MMIGSRTSLHRLSLTQVFGESVLNDAVAIVLFQTLQKSAGAPLRWAALPLLGANFAFIGIGSMIVGASPRRHAGPPPARHPAWCCRAHTVWNATMHFL